jgi:ADP-ribose pyrophosphatase YjhB (NUDIX family)
VKTRFEHSAGGVVYRRVSEGFDIALASRRTRRGELVWGLPKGAVEQDEAPEEAAVREVLEETGLEAEIRRSLGEISYWFVWEGDRVKKSVSFFLMEAIGGDTARHDHEMEEVRWFPLASAADTAGYDTERDVIRKAAVILTGDAMD